MADLSNLRTASLYINNQLLSRGLLRDGRALNFADPSGRDSKSTDDDDIDNTADTMARIISVINDLILRRDRDAEHRESLSSALRTVRAESLRQANDLHRSLERHAEAQRRADIGEAAEVSLRAQLAAAESANRKLREDAAKMRQLVAQTRASCATEVRKRDRQIDALKKAVTDAGRARGERRSPAITTITIGGGDQQQPPRSNFASPRSIHSTPQSLRSVATAAAPAATTTAESDYSLRSETNAFLAELARGLSDDNEALLSLVHHTSRQLKTMSGFVPEDVGSDNNAAAIPASGGSGSDHSLLVADMEAVLGHLRTILTNPSFVPIEEVVQRESEIGRLRDGWEKMEDRWKEAVHLLDGWRQRMADSGRSVNMEEIKMGLRLSPVRVRSVAETTQGLGLRLPPLHEALGEVDEEGEEEDYDDEDGQGYPPLGRSPSPAESLRLVPAPRDSRYEGNNRGDDDMSDIDSDSSSVFYDESEPNVQIIEQSALMPSLEPSPAPEAFSRSTPSPPPPLRQKSTLSQVTTAAVEETVNPTKKSVEISNESKTAPGNEARKDTTVDKAALQPSRTAGNRGGINASVAAAAAPAAPEVKKEAPAAGVRGRRRPGEGEPSAVRPTARPAGPRAAATTTAVARTDSKRTAAPASRQATSATAAVKSSKPISHAAITATTKPAPSTTTSGKVARPLSALSRPASAASHASEGSSSAGSARPTNQERLQKQQLSSDKTATKATTAGPPASASDQMPPPTALTTAASSTTTGASRARSRSPLKINTTDGTSRLPLPTTGVPPASPALNMATIAAKLAASEREADAARVRAKLKAMRGGLAAGTKAKGCSGTSASSSLASARALSGASEAAVSSATSVSTSATVDTENFDPVKKSVAPVDAEHVLGASINSNKSMGDGQDQADSQQQQPLRKKRDQKDNRRASRVASRRRSTLNPWELKTLMTGSADSEAADPAMAS